MKDKMIILMSSYNGEKHIRAQLDSLLRQSICSKCDILIRDDGSVDNTAVVLNEYSGAYENINVILGENIGLNKSFFELLKLAGDYRYYAFCDQDDVWFDNKLEEGLKQLNREDESIPLLYGSCSLLVNEKGNKEGTTQQQKKEIALENVLYQNIIPGHTQIFNHALKQLLCVPIDYDKLYVYDSWATLCACCFGKILFNNKPFTYYMQHEENAYGYGKGILDWIRIRLHRLNNGETKSYKKQNILFYETFYPKLNDRQKNLFEAALADKNIFARFRYILQYKPYRQKKIETLLLYFLILSGKY